jgi:hypothetical protein
MDIELKKGHIFELSRIAKKANIQIPASDDPEILGNFITSLVQNIGDVEREVDRFIAGVCKMDLNIVKNMDADEYVGLVMDVFNDPNFKRVIDRFTQGKALNNNKNLAVAPMVSDS